MVAALRRVLVASVLGAAVAGPGLVQAGAGSCEGTIIDRADGWREVRPAAFGDSSGSEGLTGFATSPQVRDLLYVTNGASVQRSVDAGCTWDTVFSSATFRVGQLTLGPEAPRVTALHVAPRDPSRLYVVLEETTAAGTPHADVLTSGDRGETFETVTRGLPAVGVPLALAPGLRRGVAYAAITTPTDDVDVYATTDAGVSWSRRGAIGAAVVTALAVDPRAEQRLWAVADERLLRSDDGGTSFRAVSKVPARLGPLAVSMTATSTRIVAAHVDEATLSLSEDDGESWRQERSPQAAEAVAAPSSPLPAVVIAGGRGVHLAVDGAPWVNVSPSGETPSQVRLSDEHPAGFDLLAMTSRAVLRRVLTGTFRPAVRAGALPPIDLGAVPVVPGGAVELSPRRMRVNLRPGEVRDVDVVLDLPPVPTPLDVMFLVDTTGSMGPTIAGLRDGIGEVVRDLARAGIDARFGLADFRDYPFDPYGGDGDYPYRLLRTVGRPDRGYADAIGKLQAGGGGDGPESTLTALYQAVTGAGQRTHGKTLVEPGLDAGFRADSLRVAVVATDTGFHREAGYPGPDFDETAAALRRQRVLQMGLSVGGGGRPDLEAMATDTGTLAPIGVDCNGDRVTDVRPGRPLVCDVDPLPIRVGLPGTRMNLAPAIIGLLRSVRDVAPVSLRATGASSMATVLAPATYPRVDVKVPNSLRYRVRLTCSDEHLGEASRTTLEALRRNTVLTSGTLDVGCAAPGAAAVAAPRPAPPPPPAQPPPAQQVAVAAVPPPPPPAQQPPAQTNPQAQPQPNPNPQLQAGGAHEEQHEQQLALAYVEADQQEQVELAMSARPRAAPDPRPLWATALVATLAAGVEARRRSARAEARA